ncbi:MAG TPA: hypothetical protein VJ486_05835 [Geothrix sp.]|nr:hypothetical protein [Geothrix sp.]
MLVSFASAQAPVLQDGATALRQARLDWTLGQEPLGPSSMPSFEVGWGGAGSEGVYTPLTEGEGAGHGTQGWGLGMQGRYVAAGWSFSATVLGLRDHGRTVGILQRAAIGYQTESGWRAALEQAPLAWGSGLNGGDLLGDASRAFPRLSLSTPEAALPLGRWRLEAFAGKLEEERAIPDWIADRPARVSAKVAGLDLQRPTLLGGLVRASFGTLVEASIGTIRLAGGRDAQGRPAPSSAVRTASLAELRLRLPALATYVHARSASVYVSGSAAPDGSAMTLAHGRELGGLQLVWDSWDLGLEYAGAAPRGAAASFLGPTYLAGFSTQGDPLGSAFGGAGITRTVELGLPLFLEGRGRLKLVRAAAPLEDPSGAGSWFLQGDAQWRTPTGKAGASLASRRDVMLASARWGWAFSVFQSFRVF